MLAQETEDLFNFTYEKTAAEIKEKAAQKTEALLTQIKHKEGLIAATRALHEIDDAGLARLFQQLRDRDRVRSGALNYLKSSTVANARQAGGVATQEDTIDAGVVNNLVTDYDAIEASRKTIAQLKVIAANLRPLKRFDTVGDPYEFDAFPLSYDELVFLGF